jgi:hypothetical protein
MDFNTTIDLIIKDLNEASEIIDDLKKYPGVPALQVELAKSKCRSAGEVIAMLKSISIPVSESPVAPVVPVQPAAPVHIVQAEPIQEKHKVRISPEKEEFTITVKSVPPPEEVKTPEKKPETKSQAKKKVEAPSVADKFSPASDLYEEKAGGLKAEKDLSEQLKAKPIASLSEAIGISDKFLFIGEIFDGNKESYSQAISRLDKAENLQDAMAIIMSYTGENTENEAVSQLIELVKLKLPSYE